MFDIFFFIHEILFFGRWIQVISMSHTSNAPLYYTIKEQGLEKVIKSFLYLTPWTTTSWDHTINASARQWVINELDVVSKWLTSDNQLLLLKPNQTYCFGGCLGILDYICIKWQQLSAYRQSSAFLQLSNVIDRECKRRAVDLGGEGDRKQMERENWSH